MNYNSTNKKRLLVLVSLTGFILVIYIVHLAISSLGFHIVSTDPNLSNVSSVEAFMQINFNEQLSSHSLKVTSTPSIIYNQIIDGKTLTLDFNTMSLNRRYTITISSAYSTKGSVIKNKSLSFTAKNISAADLSKAEQEAILKRQNNIDAPLLRDPIVKYLPYATTNYALSTVVTKTGEGQLGLEISAVITLNEADMANQSAAVDQYKQQINSYIQSLGLNPANYDIIYTVNTP